MKWAEYDEKPGRLVSAMTAKAMFRCTGCGRIVQIGEKGFSINLHWYCYRCGQAKLESLES